MRITSKPVAELKEGDIIRLYTNWESIKAIGDCSTGVRVVYTDERRVEFGPHHNPVTCLVDHER